MAGVDECADAVANVARTCARAASAMYADLIYLRSVSMVQAWSCAGLRVMCSPLTPVTSTVSPFRARSASSSCNDSGLVSSESFQTCCGSHVMSSMLMISLSRHVKANNRGTSRISPGCLSWRDCDTGISLAGVVHQPRVRRLVFAGRGEVHFRHDSYVIRTSSVSRPALWDLFFSATFSMQAMPKGHVVPSVVEASDGVSADSNCLESEHDHILSRRIATNDGAFAGLGLLGYVACGGIVARVVRACAVRPFPVSDEFQSSDTGGACCLPWFAWYASALPGVGHVGSFTGAVRAGVRGAGPGVMGVAYSVSMVQPWNRAGLRIVVSPWLSVMVRVLPRRACFDMVSSSVLVSVSSASCQTCFGSHVMSSMLMVSSFPAMFMASIRGTVGISPGCFRCGGMAVPVLSLPALLRPSRVRRLLLVGRWWGAFPATVRMVCGPCMVRGPRVRGLFRIGLFGRLDHVQ